MPDRDRFESAASYYKVLLHELTHSTGHQSRLNRLESDGFGSDSYSREELVAELGASFLAGEAGIQEETEVNSAAYIAGWLKVLKADKRLVPSAAAAAQKAADMIMDRSFDGPANHEAKQLLTAQ